jgi:hypothetical protein
MTSVLATSTGGKKNTPLLSEHIAELHLANEQDEERRYEALEYCFMDIMTCFSREFLQSMDSVNETRKIFVRQVRDFRSLVNKFPYFTADTGVDVPIIPPNSYESLISVLAMQDAENDRKAGKKTSRYINGKEVEIDPHAMMKDAGYEIDEGLGFDLKETLEDIGLLEVVEKHHDMKAVKAKDVYLGTAKREQPKSIFLDGSKTFNPTMSLDGLM